MFCIIKGVGWLGATPVIIASSLGTSSTRTFFSHPKFTSNSGYKLQVMFVIMFVH